MLLTSLDRYRNEGLLLLRIGYGIAFMAHGLPKLMAGPQMWGQIGMSMGNFGIHFAPVFWGFMSAFAEAGGGLLLLLGLFFRYACLMMSINMIVAISFHVFQHQAFGQYWSHPFEALIVFLSLFFIGPGNYALDEKLNGRRMMRDSVVEDARQGLR